MAQSSSTSKRRSLGLGRKVEALLSRIIAGGGSERGVDAERVALLLQRGLARVAEDGRVVATDEGRAHAARLAGGALGFFVQHRAVGRRTVQADGVAIDALVDLEESPLAWLARRKGRDGKPLLSVEAVAAGERLRADFTRGQMSPRVTANWEASVSRGRRGAGGANVDLADAALAARQRVGQALDAVGPELAGALVDVCCFLKGLEEVERERSWPARGAKLVLGLALDRLARHYGYLCEPRGDAGRLVRWGAPDSRPIIDGAPASS